PARPSPPIGREAAAPHVQVTTNHLSTRIPPSERRRDSCRIHLFTLDRGREIYWEGDLPELLNGNDFEAWKKRTEEAADECMASGTAGEVVTSSGRRLTVRPGKAPLGTSLAGDAVESDQGKRLLGKVRGKGAKTEGAGTAWIWARTTAASSTSLRTSPT
ncbi:hypothetical protein ACGFYV_30905, partial [Streptomyces sp. NPDC048297]|uniref:hypothetical protein n=1 Tax=Streptomyces sp. NPDC048297 TaxID=3365531 RepID=UPI0037116C10